MQDLIMVNDYFSIDKLRKSLGELAKTTFGLNCEYWHENNLLNHQYIPYSFCDEGKIVANISVNDFTLVINGNIHKAIQIGTVMTGKEYRNHGLSAQLMNYVLNKYENAVDLIYLFANSSVLEFYPKFGFKRTAENRYEIDGEKIVKQKATIRKLNISNPDDKNILLKIASDRVPVSKKIGVIRDKWPLLAYCLDDPYKNILVYLPQSDAIVIYEAKNNVIDLYDILSLNPVNLDDILSKIIEPGIKKVRIHFVPDTQKNNIQKSSFLDDDDALFVRSKKFSSFSDILFPLTSHT